MIILFLIIMALIIAWSATHPQPKSVEHEMNARIAATQSAYNYHKDA